MTEVSYYNTFALVSLIVCVLLVILDIFIWVKLDVKHYFAVLSGSEARKTIDKIKQAAESGEVQADRRRRSGKAVISWNTSEGLEDKRPYNRSGRPLSMDPEQTVLLSQGTGTASSMQADPYATMVLSTINQQTSQVQQPQYQQPQYQQPQPQPQSYASNRYESEEPQLYKPVSMPGFVVEKEIVNTAGNETTFLGNNNGK